MRKQRTTLTAHVYAFVLVVPFITAAVSAAAAPVPCCIEVVEKGSGWPVPLVQLRTTHSLVFVTDNAGVVAIDQPELLGREVFFHVEGHGYEVPADGFGIRGVRVTPQPGKTIRIEVTRTIIARRLGRLSGAGLFAESQKLGRELSAPESGVTGCDSVQTAVHRGRHFWLWGDTSLLEYPLGIFHSTGAITGLRPFRSLKPPLRIKFDYFTDGLPDKHNEPRLVASYAKIKPPLDEYEWGLCVWNDETARFEKLKTVWTESKLAPRPPPLPQGHAVIWKDEKGNDCVLFGNPFPTLRCPATYEAWRDPARWISIQPQRVVTSPEKKTIRPHTGSIAWNIWRGRWVTVFMQSFGKPSAFGELWYAEADTPLGPWGPAVKILSHNNYTFYNPRIHPDFTPAGSPTLLFEGTYTAQFADEPPPTPRYDYNQVLYRLDLKDERLVPARPSFQQGCE